MTLLALPVSRHPGDGTAKRMIGEVSDVFTMAPEKKAQVGQDCVELRFLGLERPRAKLPDLFVD
jgi:hypothetical protein